MLTDGCRRAQAFHLAAQLPEGREDALKMVEAVRLLVEAHFAPQRAFLGDCEVVPLRPESGIRPSLRASSTDMPEGSA